MKVRINVKNVKRIKHVETLDWSLKGDLFWLYQTLMYFTNFHVNENIMTPCFWNRGQIKMVDSYALIPYSNHSVIWILNQTVSTESPSWCFSIVSCVNGRKEENAYLSIQHSGGREFLGASDMGKVGGAVMYLKIWLACSLLKSTVP